jgi:hypothetical protein
MPEKVTINVGVDYSRYPVGRYRDDGDTNGERFREDYLRPKLAAGDHVRIELDDVLGYGSSFLEEVFGGLVRSGYSAKALDEKVTLVSNDDSLLAEIKSYIQEAEASRNGRC